MGSLNLTARNREVDPEWPDVIILSFYFLQVMSTKWAEENKKEL